MRTDVRLFFYLGMLIAFMGSMHPWFMWCMGDKYIIYATFCFLISMIIEALLGKERLQIGVKFGRCYTRQKFAAPLLAYIALSVYMLVTQRRNFNAHLLNLFNTFLFLALFQVRLDELKRFFNFLAKAMGGFLAISMIAYLLYLLGYNFPSREISYLKYYDFINYKYFMVSANSFMATPRFQSVFIEPGHLGTMTALLLFTQTGKWRRWYNISLLIATLISFSLEAYAILISIIFLGLWIRGQKIVRKAILATITLTAITIGANIYNNGNNMLHDLIIMRMEFEDGKMVGDNRVTQSFQEDYDEFLESSDVIKGGREIKERRGNAGFRVYIYEHGLIGTSLLILFYVLSMRQKGNNRAFWSVIIVAGIAFYTRGRPLEFFLFFSLYVVAKIPFQDTDYRSIPSRKKQITTQEIATGKIISDGH